MKRTVLLTSVVTFMAFNTLLTSVHAQEDQKDAMPDEAAAEASVPAETTPSSSKAEAPNKGSGGFISVIVGSGALGILLWLALFGAAGAGVYFGVDCAITVREKRIMPQQLITAVTEAMSEGDVLKALQSCENEPGPLANILTAGFGHVEEGFDVIQDAIGTSADLETEQIMQKLTWLSVVGNIAPMLGLLGTVQGMIMAFGNLAGGAPDVGLLAQNISQALFTTAGGLTIAVPCVAFYYTFRNMANKIILKMEAMTMELIKDLRNVEVVEE
ncbi:MAG: MotA/TolQ/ExbB proton channel family protein [Lentisphaerae bacterium]|nr:MotA/TolQ/ExbB proton channel family protein [Lentisphaerota bacterium]